MSALHPAPANGPEVGRTMEVDGAHIHYREDGVGPTVLLLHPAGLSLATFRQSIPFLSRYLRVLAPDLPGLGYSTLPEGSPATPEEMARLLARFLETLSVTGAVVCGVGEGALVGLELACRRPDLVGALLLCAPGSLTRHFPWQMKLLLHRHVGALALRFMTPATVERMLRWAYFNEIAVNPALVDEVWQPLSTLPARLALRRALLAYDDRYALSRMGSLTCPVRILWGEDDLGRPCGMADLYHETIAGATVRILRNCGGLPQEEKPREFNDEVVRLAAQARPLPDPDGPDSPFYDGLD